MDTDDFYLRVAYALSACQLVEQELKLYIAEALELVQKCVAGKLPFSKSGDDYADASLERLIDTFRKLSNNPTLLTELRKFKDERNFLSHKGIAHWLDPDGELCYVTASEFQDRLAAIEPEAQRLRLAIHEEALSSAGTCGSMMPRMRANPSIERTFSGWLRQPPSAAPVNRYPSISIS